MNAAAWALLALVVGLFAFDAATLGKRARRLLLVEAVLFAIGGYFIASPDTATLLAHKVGIGRGVDFVLYPVVIWLVRESLVNRHHRWEERERLSELVRGLAIERAEQGAQDGARRPSHSAEQSSDSRTT